MHAWMSASGGDKPRACGPSRETLIERASSSSNANVLARKGALDKRQCMSSSSLRTPSRFR